MMAGAFDIPRLTEQLKPFRLLYAEQMPSTNDLAIEMRRRQELFAPAVVLTSRQTHGRGRGANRWFAGEDSLTVTVVLPVEPQLQASQLPLVAGIAVRNLATELSGDLDIAIKWPNDVVFGGRKLAGLLCERVNQADFIGVGINVNGVPDTAANPLLTRSPVSLSEIAGRMFDRNEVLLLLVQHLQQLLLSRQSQPFAAFIDQYRQHDGLLGRELRVQVPGEQEPICGTCEGIDADGRLLLRSGTRVHRIIAGSVQER